MKLAEIFMEQSGPKGRHFPAGFISQALRRHELGPGHMVFACLLGISEPIVSC